MLSGIKHGMVVLTGLVLWVAPGCAYLPLSQTPSQPEVSIRSEPKATLSAAKVDTHETVLENLKRTQEELEASQSKGQELRRQLAVMTAELDSLKARLQQAEASAKRLSAAETGMKEANRKLDAALADLAKEQEKSRQLQTSVLDANIKITRLEQTIMREKIARAREVQAELKRYGIEVKDNPVAVGQEGSK